MDSLEAKSRVAEALVEAIFRRARYAIHPAPREALPLRFGREDFSPDFRISRRPPDGDECEFLVEVKYRPSVEQFLSVEKAVRDPGVIAAVEKTGMAVDHRPAEAFQKDLDRELETVSKLVKALNLGK
jgi:hypothetical protein